MTNQLIIFSKNRASQLNLLLDSIKQNAHLFFDKISVLYKSDEEYLVSYNKLKNEYLNIDFILERDFRKDTINLINEEMNMTTFMVDDAVIYNPIFNKEFVLKQITSDVICFSLRLGKNCIFSHPSNTFYNLKDFIEDDFFISFDFKNQEIGDFSYPLSTDGHIYKTELIKELLTQIDFTNPNTLESNLQIFLTKVPTKVISFIESHLVSIPVNIVNTVFKNRHGLEYFISEKELNDKYINGEKIDLNQLNFMNINGPHKEIKYEFKKG